MLLRKNCDTGKGLFRECFNQTWNKIIKRYSTLESDFGSLSKEWKDGQIKWNNDEIIFYLKSQYYAHNDEQRTFIPNIPSKESIPSFEAITGCLKTFFKYIKENENIDPKKEILTGG